MADLQFCNWRGDILHRRRNKSPGLVIYRHSRQILHVIPSLVARTPGHLTNTVAVPLPQCLRELSILASSFIAAHCDYTPGSPFYHLDARWRLRLRHIQSQLHRLDSFWVLRILIDVAPRAARAGIDKPLVRRVEFW